MMAAKLSAEKKTEILRLLQAGHTVYRVVRLSGAAERTVAKIRDAHGIKPHRRGRGQEPRSVPPEVSLRTIREVGGVRLVKAGFPAVSKHPDRACKGADPALFFGDKPGQLAKVVEARAKAFCARCPVRVECLAWALPITDLYGLWGGMTMREREDWRINNSAEES